MESNFLGLRETPIKKPGKHAGSRATKRGTHKRKDAGIDWPPILRVSDAGFQGHGFTVSLSGEEIQEGDCGYVVSLLGFEERFSSRPSRRKIRRYILKNLPQLRGRYVGGWYDAENDQYVLDVSTVMQDRAEALAFAAENMQQCIYDLATGDYIDAVACATV